jgi:hypothetical protein
MNGERGLESFRVSWTGLRCTENSNALDALDAFTQA